MTDVTNVIYVLGRTLLKTEVIYHYLVQLVNCSDAFSFKKLKRLNILNNYMARPRVQLRQENTKILRL